MEDDFGEFYFGAVYLVEAEIIEEVDMVDLEEAPQMEEALQEVGRNQAEGLIKTLSFN